MSVHVHNKDFASGQWHDILLYCIQPISCSMLVSCACFLSLSDVNFYISTWPLVLLKSRIICCIWKWPFWELLQTLRTTLKPKLSWLQGCPSYCNPMELSVYGHQGLIFFIPFQRSSIMGFKYVFMANFGSRGPGMVPTVMMFQA